jgi:hypothetical protein
MAQNIQAAWSSRALAGADQDVGRWPAPYPAMLVTVSAVLLWAAIIGGLRWLLA